MRDAMRGDDDGRQIIQRHPPYFFVRRLHHHEAAIEPQIAVIGSDLDDAADHSVTLDTRVQHAADQVDEDAPGAKIAQRAGRFR